MVKLSKIDGRYRRLDAGRILQGDILRDVDFVYTADDEKEVVIKYFLPYMIILSQDCDLEQDFKNRNENDSQKHDAYLQSILVCPAYLSDHFREGDHLKEFELKMEYKNSQKFSAIKRNLDPRYHYLDQDPNLQVPNLIVDFKHYYTLPVDFLYKIYGAHYIASLNELFREAISQRFSFYFSRIGLPELDTVCE